MPIDDEYSQWLRIPPDVSRPPNHYALLGLPTFCADAKAIEEAADRQLERLDRHALDPDLERRAQCQRMMDEVAQARLTVIHPQRRAAYDRRLIANGVVPVSDAQSDPTTASEIPAADAAPAQEESTPTSIDQWLRRARVGAEAYSAWIIGAAVTGVFVTVYLVYGRSAGRPQAIVQRPTANAVAKVASLPPAGPARPTTMPQTPATQPGLLANREHENGAAENQPPRRADEGRPQVTLATTRSATAPAPEKWRMLVYNNQGSARVLKNGVEVLKLAAQDARFTADIDLVEGDVIEAVVSADGNGCVRLAGFAPESERTLIPAPADIKDLTGMDPGDMDADKVDAARAAAPVEPGDPAANAAWARAARGLPLYDSQCMAAGERREFTLGFTFRPNMARAKDGPRDASARFDPGNGAWKGSLVACIFGNGGVGDITIVNQQHWSMGGPKVLATPEITLHAGDVVVLSAAGGDSTMRAGFLSSDGKVVMSLRAADLHDVTGLRVSTLTAQQVAAAKRAPVAVAKVRLSEVETWERVNQGRAPHGSEYFTTEYPARYDVAFVVTDRLMRAAPQRPHGNSESLASRFNDAAKMAESWRWKANLTMSPKGATGPQEPDNEMVSRFTMEGDFSVDLDADFGRAAYTNTGGMLIAVCGQDLGFDGGWNFGSWGGFTAKVRVQRRGDELQLIRDGWALVVPVPEAQRDKPTHWRLWWRSRASTFRSITVTADRLIVDKAEDAKGKKGN
ncbi:MAG: type fimbrial assembly protein PilB [Phycisphaerales bacterium]|nr:type fimbrial assembly protein PilB [Phycisphaerales bacterium]